MKNLPDRWLKYRPIGDQVLGTRFLAFKVPLTENKNCRIPSDKRLTPSLLLDQVPQLGMIIDLTNTTRYYSPRFFQDHGVEHRKIQVPGHIVPPTSLTERFNEIVAKYLNSDENAGKLIGVHCTHGVNRAGYFVCNYMVSRMNFEPKEAIRRFGLARGHNIERPNYIDALYRLRSSHLLEPGSPKRQYRSTSRTRSVEKNRISRGKRRSQSKSQSRSRELYDTRKNPDHSFSPSKGLYKVRLNSNSRANSYLHSRSRDTPSLGRNDEKRRSLSRARDNIRAISPQQYRYRNGSPPSRYISSPATDVRTHYKPTLRDNEQSRYGQKEPANIRLSEKWGCREKSKTHFRSNTSPYGREDRIKRSASPLSWRRANHVDEYNKLPKPNTFHTANVEVTAIRPRLRSISRDRSLSRSRRLSQTRSRQIPRYADYDHRNATLHKAEYLSRGRNYLETHRQKSDGSPSPYFENWRRNPNTFQRYYNPQNSRYKWDRRLDNRHNPKDGISNPNRGGAPVGSTNAEPVSFMAHRYGDVFKNNFKKH